MSLTSILLLEFAFLSINRQDTKTILKLIKKSDAESRETVDQLMAKQYRTLLQDHEWDQDAIDDLKDCFKRYRVIYIDRVNTLILRSSGAV